MLDFGNDTLGLALNLEADLVGAAILGDPNAVKEGDRVRSTGRIIEVPVGDGLMGRVVDPLGRPLDGKGAVNTSGTRSAETVAPNVVVRQSVNTPVQTGIKAIDSMIPIGRGQRELIMATAPRARLPSPSTRSSTRRAATSSASTSPSGRSRARWPRWSARWRKPMRWGTLSW